MKNFEKIPIEALEERPKVFSHKSFPAVIRFARRFDRMRIPVTPKKREVYNEKYGEVDGITNEDFKNIASLQDLKKLVDDKMTPIMEQEIKEVLRGAETTEDRRPMKGKKSLWKGDDQTALLKTVVEGSFDDIDEDRTALRQTALGLRLVSERARTDTLTRALEIAPETVLQKFGMTEPQRDIFTRLMHTITKINAEYLRHNFHLSNEMPYAKRPVDSIREHNFVAKELNDISQFIQNTRGDVAIFRSREQDEHFLRYLEKLQQAYIPLSDERRQPLSLKEKQWRLQQAQDTFLSLHTEFPDFPLIVFPAFSHYGSDDAVSESNAGDAWRKFGFDPEIRLYWQSPGLAEKQPIYDTMRKKFVEQIDNTFSDLVDTADVNRYRVILGEPVSASGINLVEATDAQEEKNIVLIVDSEPDDSDERALTIFMQYLEEQGDRELMQKPELPEFLRRIKALHEFGHGLYPEASQAANTLGKYDDVLAELKSELSLWTTATNVLKEEASRMFGSEKALRATQLALSFNAVRDYRTMDAEDDDLPYFLAAKGVLEALMANGILTEKDGKIKLASEKLGVDLSSVFGQKLREMLTIYHTASTGNLDDFKTANRLAKDIILSKPSVILNKVKNI